MKNFFKKAYDIYNSIMMFSFALLLNAIVIGVLIVIPMLYLLDGVKCPF